MSEQKLQAGDRVAFDVHGSPKTPFGYGVVTRVNRDGTMLINPQSPMPGHMKMLNIRKAEVKK